LNTSVPMGRVVAAVVVATILAGHGKRKGSLSTSGATAAFLVGLLHWLFSYELVAMLLAFYLSSSRLTKYQASRKKALEEDFKEGGQRNAIQVGPHWQSQPVQGWWCWSTHQALPLHAPPH
jgi:uncharacterized membrane protein